MWIFNQKPHFIPLGQEFYRKSVTKALKVLNENFPPEAKQIYDQAYDKAIAEGDASDVATQYALQVLNLAGWYKTGETWERISPDVRGKVNHRKAVRQLDGTYLVPDVAIFHPNAAKAGSDGKPLAIDKTAIDWIVENTKRAASNGGAETSLHVYHLSGGKGGPSCGQAVNMRVDEAGTVFADFARVPEATVNEWKKGGYPGISAGLVTDAGGKNARLDHVALLPAGAPALSDLPRTVVYSAGDYLCFSAAAIPDYPELYFPRSDLMPNENKMRRHVPKIKAALDEFSAATKPEEFSAAMAHYSAAMTEFNADHEGHEEEHDRGEHKGHEKDHASYCAKCREHDKNYAAASASTKTGTPTDGESRHSDTSDPKKYLRMTRADEVQSDGGASIAKGEDSPALTPNGLAFSAAIKDEVGNQIAKAVTEALAQFKKDTDTAAARAKFVSQHVSPEHTESELAVLFDATSSNPAALAALSKTLEANRKQASTPTTPLRHVPANMAQIYTERLFHEVPSSINYSAANDDLAAMGKTAEATARILGRNSGLNMSFDLKRPDNKQPYRIGEMAAFLAKAQMPISQN